MSIKVNYENDLIADFQNIFDGFNELVQVFFGFALGLAFSQTNITVGWIFFWIVIWELGVYLIFGKTKYYDPFFRLAYNCIFILAIITGQYTYYDKTTFQDFLYPDSIETKNTYSGKKLQIMEIFENKLDEMLNGEENDNKRKKYRKRVNLFRN